MTDINSVDEEELIQSLRKALSPSEETELLRLQLKTLKEYLKQTNPALYLTVFGESIRRVEPKISLKKSLKSKKGFKLR